ncbi:crossover junction endodeoxyribonuclease RuvC [Candidatus Kaiserbacteria bacterium]|nr:crossover junction endodeoxyribonuclease RuvC [Candidatus Kaiserbacteria bacterium]
MRVLAIDPGYERLGIAVVEKKERKEVLLYSDCFRTNPKDVFEERLLQIGTEVERIIKEYGPDALATEQLYFNTNQKTVMYVAEVIGVINYISRKNNLMLFDYSPLQVKNAVSGYGRSTKEQVAKMVPQLIEIRKEIKFDDEYDAIAIGLTCLASERDTVPLKMK